MASRAARPRSTSPPATSSRSCSRSASAGETAAEPFDIYRALRRLNPSPYMFFFDFADLAGGEPLRLIGASPEMHVRLEGRQRRHAADRRHAPARRDAGRRRCAGARAAGRPRRSAPSTSCWSTWRATTWAGCASTAPCTSPELMARRALLARHAHRLAGGRPAAAGNTTPSTCCGPPSRPARSAARRRSAPWRSSTSWKRTAARPLRRARSATSPTTARWTPASPSAPWSCRAQTVSVQAGAGIVADSDPEREYQETLNKARALAVAVRRRKREWKASHWRSQQVTSHATFDLEEAHHDRCDR